MVPCCCVPTGDVTVKMVDDEEDEEALDDSSRSAEQKKKLWHPESGKTQLKTASCRGQRCSSVLHRVSSGSLFSPKFPHVFWRFFIVRGTFHRPRTPDMPRLGPGGMTLSPSSQSVIIFHMVTSTNHQQHGSS